MNPIKVSESHRYSCKNKRTDYPSIEVQDGWNGDGARKMVSHRTDWLPIKCGHSFRSTDPACRDCRLRR